MQKSIGNISRHVPEIELGGNLTEPKRQVHLTNQVILCEKATFRFFGDVSYAAAKKMLLRVADERRLILA